MQQLDHCDFYCYYCYCYLDCYLYCYCYYFYYYLLLYLLLLLISLSTTSTTSAKEGSVHLERTLVPTKSDSVVPRSAKAKKQCLVALLHCA